ncbi:hypothetical protein [Stenotrophomonas rhizophila]|uniref:hypothetical protein n=1 Tax=Stenotrophomonas rhizophila TaxID=216778 RepID=UPI001E3F5F99|nr:hypothetical protein [Stenotrophomonas rhizophila]MCC7633418.1 hypothetical protein [Stenotrophomonas rhizophila]MCC7663097.1 hypothetical protein [Stenotrophomonas rhizophila]
MIQRAALLVLLCGAVGAVQAAPAATAEVDALLQTLNKGSLGASQAEMMVEEVPALKALPEADRQCARTSIQSFFYGHVRQSLISSLGEDGDAVVADWSRFLATPSGKGYLIVTGALPESAADASINTQDEAYSAGFEAFLGSASFKRLNDGFDAMSAPDELAVRLTRGLQDQCRIALKPDDIS